MFYQPIQTSGCTSRVHAIGSGRIRCVRIFMGSSHWQEAVQYAREHNEKVGAREPAPMRMWSVAEALQAEGRV